MSALSPTMEAALETRTSQLETDLAKVTAAFDDLRKRIVDLADQHKMLEYRVDDLEDRLEKMS